MLTGLKMLIAGCDYFDNAKCSLFLDHLVNKIQYTYLSKEVELLSEVESEKYNIAIMSLDIKEEILQNFKKYYLMKEKPILFVFYGKYGKEYYDDFFNDLSDQIKAFPFLETPFSPIKMADALRAAVKLHKTQNQQPLTDESLSIEIASFIAVKLQFLNKFNKIPFEIYIKIRDDKYIKLRNRGDVLDEEIIERYKSKGIDAFYLTSSDFNDYHELIYTLPFLKMSTKPKTPEEKMQEIHGLILEIISDLGISETSISLVNQISKNILAFAGQSASLSLMLEAALKNSHSYVYDHSYMTSLLISKISKKLTWVTPAIEEKMCMGALFHDLNLGHAKYLYGIDVKKNSLNNMAKIEQKDYLQHPIEMASILNECPLISQEIINIVYHQHEKVDGTGFPKKLSSQNMSPIIGLFLLAHDFVNELYSINFNKIHFSTLVEKLVEKYDVGNFKEIATAFKSSMQDELKAS